jgi:hypothetical protein
MSAIELFRQSTALTPLQSAQAARTVRRSELAAFRHGLGAAVQAECDRQDTQAVADACSTALDAELDLLDWGMHRAGNSAAKAELVARKVSRLAAINDSRITRRFGR